MSEAALPYIPAFRIAPRQYTLHNAGPDSFDLKWGGLMFTIPGVNEVGIRAAVYDDGEKIPGTCILKDASAPGKEGTVEPNLWRAEDAIRNVLGIDIETGIASGMPAMAGISFLPDRPSRELVGQVRDDGKRRWYQSQVTWAEHETAARMGAIELAKEHGTVPPTPSKDYRKAVMILDEYHKTLNETFGETVEETVEALTHDDEIEMEIYLKASAIAMAEKASAELNVDKNKVAEEMLQDPKIRKHLQKKYSIRKKGHTEEGSLKAIQPPPQSIELPDQSDAGEPPGEG